VLASQPPGPVRRAAEHASRIEGLRSAAIERPICTRTHPLCEIVADYERRRLSTHGGVLFIQTAAAERAAFLSHSHQKIKRLNSTCETLRSLKVCPQPQVFSNVLGASLVLHLVRGSGAWGTRASQRRLTKRTRSMLR